MATFVESIRDSVKIVQEICEVRFTLWIIHESFSVRRNVHFSPRLISFFFVERFHKTHQNLTVGHSLRSYSLRNSTTRVMVSYQKTV